MAEPLPLSTPAAAELLGRPEVARLLKPFMRGPRTCGQAANELGLPVEALHYRVQQFCRAGLLQVAGTQPRRGRSSKLYEAVATDFVFPSHLLSPETRRALGAGEAWYAEFRANLERLLPEPYPELVRVTLTPDGTLHWQQEFSTPEAQHRLEARLAELPPALHVQTAALYLTPQDAEALADELAELFNKYHGRGGPRRYAMILGFTPLDRPVD